MIINHLKKIINKKYEIPLIPINSKNNSVIIKETKPDAKLKRVEITGFYSENTYAFTLDKDEKLKTISKYFASSEENINKVCDAIIFTNLNQKDYVFFCELKSEKPQVKDYMVQYQNSTLFIDYLINILNNFYLQEYQIKPIKKYILFDTKKQEVKRNLNRDMKIGKTLISPKTKEFNGFKRPIYMIHRQSFRDNNPADIIMSINSLKM
ncbi:MAG: hypothetical protein AB4062_08510 [Crocosphaera sp.]